MLERPPEQEKIFIPEYELTDRHWSFIRVTRSIMQNAALSWIKNPSQDEFEMYYNAAKSQGCSIKNARLAVFDVAKDEILTGHNDVDKEYAEYHNRHNPLPGRGFNIEFDDLLNERTVRAMIFDNDSLIEKSWVQTHLSQCVNILKREGLSYQYRSSAVVVLGDKQIY